MKNIDSAIDNLFRMWAVLFGHALSLTPRVSGTQRDHNPGDTSLATETAARLGELWQRNKALAVALVLDTSPALRCRYDERSWFSFIALVTMDRKARLEALIANPRVGDGPWWLALPEQGRVIVRYARDEFAAIELQHRRSELAVTVTDTVSRWQQEFLEDQGRASILRAQRKAAKKAAKVDGTRKVNANDQ